MKQLVETYKDFQIHVTKELYMVDRYSFSYEGYEWKPRWASEWPNVETVKAVIDAHGDAYRKQIEAKKEKERRENDPILSLVDAYAEADFEYYYADHGAYSSARRTYGNFISKLETFKALGYTPEDLKPHLNEHSIQKIQKYFN